MEREVRCQNKPLEIRIVNLKSENYQNISCVIYRMHFMNIYWKFRVYNIQWSSEEAMGDQFSREEVRLSKNYDHLQ